MLKVLFNAFICWKSLGYKELFLLFSTDTACSQNWLCYPRTCLSISHSWQSGSILYFSAWSDANTENYWGITSMSLESNVLFGFIYGHQGLFAPFSVKPCGHVLGTAPAKACHFGLVHFLKEFLLQPVNYRFWVSIKLQMLLHKYLTAHWALVHSTVRCSLDIQVICTETVARPLGYLRLWSMYLTRFIIAPKCIF